VAIVQSNYIPWKGYFDLIRSVDEFILFDDVQYTRRDWRNRNQIKTKDGLKWLTIPVAVKGKYFQSIRETETSDPAWAESHWRTLCHAYARAPFFELYRPVLEPLYRSPQPKQLSEVNHRFLSTICGLLDIGTRITWSTDYQHAEGKNERLISLCRQAGATAYLSGPSAGGYLDESMFTQARIRLLYADYADYPPYRQLHGPFEHHVSILDLLFNAGPEAVTFMKLQG
jgi:hypothetical protein